MSGHGRGLERRIITGASMPEAQGTTQELCSLNGGIQTSSVCCPCEQGRCPQSPHQRVVRRSWLGILDHGPGLVCISTAGAVAEDCELGEPALVGKVEPFQRNEAFREPSLRDVQGRPGPLVGRGPVSRESQCVLEGAAGDGPDARSWHLPGKPPGTQHFALSEVQVGQGSRLQVSNRRKGEIDRQRDGAGVEPYSQSGVDQVPVEPLGPTRQVSEYLLPLQPAGATRLPVYQLFPTVVTQRAKRSGLA